MQIEIRTLQTHALQMRALQDALKERMDTFDAFKQATTNDFPAANLTSTMNLTTRLDALQEVAIVKSEHDMQMQSRMDTIESMLAPLIENNYKFSAFFENQNPSPLIADARLCPQPLQKSDAQLIGHGKEDGCDAPSELKSDAQAVRVSPEANGVMRNTASDESQEENMESVALEASMCVGYCEI